VDLALPLLALAVSIVALWTSNNARRAALRTRRTVARTEQTIGQTYRRLIATEERLIAAGYGSTKRLADLGSGLAQSEQRLRDLTKMDGPMTTTELRSP
jgi:hypothetical protein